MANSSALLSTTDVRPIYFFREKEVPFGYLSQWYICPFTAPPPAGSKSTESMTFLTTEQYMMYCKAIVFEDVETAEKIIKETTPRKQKQLGREVKSFNNKIWNTVREQIVEEGNWWKFTQGKQNAAEMRNLLLETGHRMLVEASPFDRIWGVGFSATNAEGNRDKWGQNLLGKALMRVRERLQAEDKDSETTKAEEVAVMP